MMRFGHGGSNREVVSRACTGGKLRRVVSASREGCIGFNKKYICAQVFALCHLMHVKLLSDDNDSGTEWVIVIGIIGMVVSVLGNIEGAEEMYPLFLQKVYEHTEPPQRKQRGLFFMRCIPTSVLLSFCSDACIAVYGLYNNDVLVALYGALNSFVLLFTILSIHERMYWSRPWQEWV